MTRLGSTSPRMTRWAHDAAARVARPVKRRVAVATRDAGNARFFQFALRRLELLLDLELLLVLVRVDLVEHALRLVEVLRARGGARFSRLAARVDGV